MKNNNQMNRRIVLFTCFVSICFFAVVGKLFYWQILRHDEVSQLAKNNHMRNITIPSKRGDILDVNGESLAINIRYYECWTNPTRIIDEEREAFAKTISPIINVAEETILDKISREGTLVKLATNLTDEQSMEIEQLNLGGIWTAEYYKRIYPFNDLASYVVGHTTVDNQGIAGLEYTFNNELNGENGTYTITTDGAGRQLPFGQAEKIEPINGSNLSLTIDSTIQYFAEMRVDEVYQEMNPKSAAVIVMDPYTGAIIAMANSPDYNLNDPRKPIDIPQETFNAYSDEEKLKYWNQIWKNPITSIVYEPGSTFKNITAAIALEEGIADFDSEFLCNGYIMVTGTKLHCWIHPGSHGHQSFKEALANSCNPAFAELSAAIGKEKFYEYIRAFGFGQGTGIELPGEASSLLINEEKVVPVDLAVLGYGHGISVTPLEMITATSAIVNGGYLVEPHIIDAITDEHGRTIQKFDPIVKRQVLSESTSRKMREMLNFVVEYEALDFKFDGVQTGGKTGTSVKIVDGKYKNDLTVASFVGVVPIDDPQYVILVVVDEPEESIFGSQVAIPVARDIIQDILIYKEMIPGSNSSDYVDVPNFIGMNISEAKAIIEKKGLVYTTDPIKVDEKSIVLDQYPKSGRVINKNSMIVLYTGEH